MSKTYRFSNKGTSLVEALIGVSVIALTILGSVTTFNLYIKSWSKNTSSIQSSYLIDEGLEIVYLLRDAGWTANIVPLTIGNSYYFNWSGGNWITNVTPNMIDNEYVRYVIFGNAYRDAQSNLADSGTLDPNTRKATVYVSWFGEQGTTTRSTTTYISDLFDN